MPRTISWLHLSDRHTNSTRTGWDAAKVIRTLEEDLKSLQKDHGLRPDFIFFTGDLGWGQTGSKGGEQLSHQLAEGHKLFESVRNAFDPPVPIENVFLIPGNHDINRDSVTPPLTSWLDRDATPSLVDEMLRDGKLHWQQYAERLKEYREFLQAHGYTHLLTDPTRLTYTAVREAAGHRIGISGFNSAWSCCRNNEKGKLWVGGHWQSETLATAVLNTDIKIALVHHPGGWIVEHESNHFWRYGLQEQFNVVLHGHEHESWADQLNETITISAGACYDRQDKRNGYNFVRLFPDTRSGEVWFRTFDNRGGGWVPDQIAKRTDARGVRALEGIKWLKPEDPSGGSVTTSPDSGGQPPTTLNDIRAKADVVKKAVEQAFGGEAEALVETKLTDAATPVVASRAMRPQSGFVQQIVVVNIIFSGDSLPLAKDTASASDPIDRFKSIFEEIDGLIRTYRVDEAQAAIDKLVEHHPHDLTPHERFRIHLRRAHVLYERRDLITAALKYREAVSLDPGDKHARYFLALAAELEGKTTDAHALAEQLLVDQPDFDKTAVISLWMRTAPPEQTLAKIRERFGDEVCELPDVAYTLARRAADEGLLDDALRYQEIAVKEKPAWTDARSSLAAMLIEKRFGKLVTAGHSRPPVRDWKDFDRVINLLTVALAEVERGQVPAHASALHQNIALAFAAVGRQEDAIGEYEKAFVLEPDSAELLARYAIALVKGGRADDAVTVLRTWRKAHEAPQISLQLAQILGGRLLGDEKSGDLKEPIEILEAGRSVLPSIDDTLRGDWIAVLVRFYIASNNVAAARNVLNETPSNWLDAPLRHLLIADVEDAAGNRAEAKKAVAVAAASLTPSTHPTTVRHVAVMLEQLGEFERAAKTWRQVATMKEIGLDEERILFCLQRANDAEGLIAACRELRLNGIYEERILNGELATLERISPERLSQTLEELLQAPISEKLRKELRAELSYVSIFTDKPELIEKDAARLPRANEVENARAGRMIVEVIRRGPQPFAAVQYAYELFRRFPNEPEAHLAMIFAPGLPQRTSEWAEPSTATVGAAVRYRENDTKQEFWCIIEDLPSPKTLLLEHAPTDAIARAMDGKAVGDVFTLRNTPLPRREATIVEIISKYTYRIRDCIEHFETRYPDHQKVIWKVHAGEDGQAGIDELLRQVDAKQKHQNEIDEIYRTQNITQFIYGEATGQSVFEAVHSVVSKPGLLLRACIGTPNEQHAGRTAMKQATTYVLDPVAVAILHILHSSGTAKFDVIFEALQANLVISERTLSDVRGVLANFNLSGGFAVGKQGDQYVRQIVSAEDAQREYDRVRDFIALLRTRCTVAAAEHPAPADIEWYNKLVETIGPAGAESVRLVAANPEWVLWTDEYFSALLAQPRIGNRRTWTKLVADVLTESKRLPSNTGSAIAILLFRLRYHFTGLNADTLLLAASQSNWKGFNEPLRTLLTQYAEPTVTMDSAIQSSSNFLVRVWTYQSTRKHLEIAKGITHRLLNEILKRPDGTTLIWYIRRMVSRALDQRDRHLGKQWRKAVRSSLPR